MIKTGQVAVAGRVNGVWDKEKKEFVVKRGKTSKGDKYQIFSMKHQRYIKRCVFF